MTAINVLSVLAVVLILAGIGALVFYRRSKKRAAPSYHIPAVKPRSREDELNALGILEIRSKKAPIVVEVEESAVEIEEGVEEETDELSGPIESEAEVEIVSVEEADALPGEDVEIDQQQIVSENVLEERTPVAHQTGGEKRGGVSRREALFRLMNAVQASVDGYTACLVKRELDGLFKVEAIVSQNPRALDSEKFSLAELFEDDKVRETAVTVIEIGTDVFPSETLRYYSEPVAVRQLAIAPVKGTDSIEPYFLLVDALAWQDLDDPWQRLMIGQFATLIGTFLATPISEEDGGEFVRPRVRSRREIIAEEIEKARSEEHPLALALIYLNRAEDVASAGEKALVDTERAMANRLGNAINGGRLERFGELTYGVFHIEDVSEVEAWALQLQEELQAEGPYFEGGVSIGIALLQERHKNADDFRADATEALREAFETGACTIIE